MAHRNKNDYSMFTIERYETIVKHKTAYYSYTLPVGLGMLLANITDKEVLRKTEDICLDIGKFFQIQVSALRISHNLMLYTKVVEPILAS